MKKLAIICLAVLFTACPQRPVVDAGPDSLYGAAYGLELIFVVDDCNVYRFTGGDGYSKYLTTCPGSVSGTTPQGKHTRQESIPTVVPVKQVKPGFAY